MDAKRDARFNWGSRLNIYIPLWLFWAAPPAIYLLGVLVTFGFVVKFRIKDKASGKDNRSSWKEDILVCFKWPLVILVMLVFFKVK